MMTNKAGDIFGMLAKYWLSMLFFWLMILHRNFCRTIIDKQTKFNLVFMLRLATRISSEDTSSGCMCRFESGYLCLFIAYKLRCQFIKSSNIDAKKVLDSTWFLSLWSSTPINTRILTYGLLLWLLAKKKSHSLSCTSLVHEIWEIYYFDFPRSWESTRNVRRLEVLFMFSLCFTLERSVPTARESRIGSNTGIIVSVMSQRKAKENIIHISV